MIRCTFYIGLYPGSDAKDTRRSKHAVRQRRRLAREILDARFKAWTQVNGTGRWEGSPEPTMIATVYLPGPAAAARKDASATAELIARALEQDCILLEVSPTHTDLVGRGDA